MGKIRRRKKRRKKVERELEGNGIKLRMDYGDKDREDKERPKEKQGITKGRVKTEIWRCEVGGKGRRGDEEEEEEKKTNDKAQTRIEEEEEIIGGTSREGKRSMVYRNKKEKRN